MWLLFIITFQFLHHIESFPVEQLSHWQPATLADKSLIIKVFVYLTAQVETFSKISSCFSQSYPLVLFTHTQFVLIKLITQETLNTCDNELRTTKINGESISGNIYLLMTEDWRFINQRDKFPNAQSSFISCLIFWFPCNIP